VNGDHSIHAFTIQELLAHLGDEGGLVSFSMMKQEVFPEKTHFRPQYLDFSNAVPVTWLLHSVGADIPFEAREEPMIKDRSRRYLAQPKLSISDLPPGTVEIFVEKRMPGQLEALGLYELHEPFDSVEYCRVIIVEMSNEIPFRQIKRSIHGVGPGDAPPINPRGRIRSTSGKILEYDAIIAKLRQPIRRVVDAVIANHNDLQVFLCLVAQ
jgi:hypothetical protein